MKAAAMDKNLVDISGSPIAVGDFIIIVDPVKEERHKFFVEEVEQINEFKRNISVKVLETTDKDLSKHITFELDSTEECLGIVIRAAANQGTSAVKFKAQVPNDSVARSLKEYLDTKHDSNYKERIMTLVNYLIGLGLIPGDDLTRAKRRMMNIVRNRKDLFYSAGGWIFSVNEPIAVTVGGGGGSSRAPILIDWAMLKLGLKTVLKSIGSIKLINDEN